MKGLPERDARQMGHFFQMDRLKPYIEMMPAFLSEEDKVKGAQFIADTFGEDKLASVIRAHLYMEATLNLLIEECLVEPAAFDLDRLNFRMKVGLVIALGAIDPDFKRPLEMLNEFRNRFAHNINAQLTELDEDKFFKSFSKKHRDLIQGDGLLIYLPYLHGSIHGELKAIRAAKLEAQKS